MNYRLIRSSRRTLAVEISHGGEIIVRAPYITSTETIENFLADNSLRIEAAVERAKKRVPTYSASSSQAQELREMAERKILPRVEHFSYIMGVKPQGVRITAAEKRFGSCSSRGSICFSFNLAQYSDDLIDYVVVHELAHLKEMNHSSRFYKIIESVLPDYKTRKKLLKK